MNIKCGECGRDLRRGHHPSCSMVERECVAIPIDVRLRIAEVRRTLAIARYNSTVRMGKIWNHGRCVNRWPSMSP